MAQNRTLFNSVIGNNINSLEEGIENQKLDVNMRSEGTGFTALMMAVNKKNVDIIKVLLAYKADPDITDHRGNTPLSAVVLQFKSDKDKSIENKERCLEIASLLLKAGADPEVKNKYGETPFFWVKDDLTSDERSMKDLLEKYRKQPDFTAVPPVTKKDDKEIMSTQQIAAQVPTVPPRENISCSITKQEANEDENVGDDAPLLSSNRYGSFKTLAAKRYDLVISDLGLPDGSGNDIVAKVKASPESPAIQESHLSRKPYLPQPSFFEMVTSMFFEQPKCKSEDSRPLIGSGPKLKQE